MMAFETALQLQEALEVMLVIIHYIQQLRCVCVCSFAQYIIVYLLRLVLGAIRYIQYRALHTVHMRVWHRTPLDKI